MWISISPLTTRIAEQFFIRIAFHPQEEGFSADEFNRAFKTFAARYDMTWTLTPPDKRPKVAILVSKYDMPKRFIVSPSDGAVEYRYSADYFEPSGS